MTFCEALEAAKNGAKIRNQLWSQHEYAAFNSLGFLRLYSPGINEVNLVVLKADFKCDWVVVE